MLFNFQGPFVITCRSLKRLRYYIMLSFVCQHLFSFSFWKFLPASHCILPSRRFNLFSVSLQPVRSLRKPLFMRFLGVCLADSSYIISCLPLIVNTFFQTFSTFLFRSQKNRILTPFFPEIFSRFSSCLPPFPLVFSKKRRRKPGLVTETGLASSSFFPPLFLPSALQTGGSIYSIYMDSFLAPAANRVRVPFVFQRWPRQHRCVPAR